MKKIKHLFIVLSMMILCGTTAIMQAQVGALTTTGDFLLTGTGTYEVEVKDLSGVGSGHDQIVVSNNVTLNGTLDILLSGYSPEEGDAFEIMTYGGTLSGTFSTINWPADMVTQGWVIDYGVDNPGTVTILGPLVALPVELIFFSVAAKEGVHTLHWQTASEVGNDFFAVEYSSDGSRFSTLGKVAGKGNSNTSQSYSYAHQPNQNGYHYYRLQQVDLDGAFTYSKIISFFENTKKDLSFFPNPTTGSITFNEPVSSVIVHNVKGEEVLNLKGENTTFDLSELPTGTFFIQVNENPTLTEKLIINK